MRDKTIFALGFFDGVHAGHAALLAECRRLAKENGCKASAVTFAQHPASLLVGKAPPLINSLSLRQSLLQYRNDLTKIEILPFDKEMMNMSWQDFFQMLRTEHNAAGFVCGEDFRFGYKGEGTAQKLKEACEAENMPCTVVPPLQIDGVTVSSSYIRKLLEDGEMEKACRFLGHPHFLSGTVQHGDGRGRTWGIPTANLELPEELVQLRHGVYACDAVVDMKERLAVVNVGTRPTVDGEKVVVEAWLLDFEGDLYDKYMMLRFHKFLRPEQKFDSVEALQAQIQKDAEKTRKYFSKK